MTQSPGTARWRRLVAELVEVRPAPHAHRVAVRAAVSMLVPLGVLWSIGRLDLAAYATFGAFASVYGGGARSRSRWRVQSALGAVLATSVVVGALVGLSPLRSWLAIPVTAAWAGAAAALSDRHGWRPPGPMFPVFAIATASAIPATPIRVLEAGTVVISTAVVAVLLGVVEVVVLHATGLRPADPAAPPPAPPARHRRRIQLVRCVVVVLVAGAVATAVGVGHPYWAMVAAVTPLTVFTLRSQVLRGVHRALGTVVGLLVAAGLLAVSPPAPVIILVLVALQAVVELLVVRHYGLALVFITPLALLSAQLADPLPVGQLLTDRLVETVIGVAVGMLAAVLTRDRRTVSA